MSKVPETSLEAYKSLDAKQLNDKYRKIISALEVLGEGTTEEVASYLKVAHETVWKRFSELSSMQIIYRPGNKRLMKSGRNGFTWRLCNPSKTEDQLKSTKPISEYSKNIETIKNQVIQQDLF